MTEQERLSLAKTLAGLSPGDWAELTKKFSGLMEMKAAKLQFIQQKEMITFEEASFCGPPGLSTIQRACGLRDSEEPTLPSYQPPGVDSRFLDQDEYRAWRRGKRFRVKVNKRRSKNEDEQQSPKCSLG